MTLPVADVLTRTDDLLTDEDRTRWPVEERIRWMNEAMGAILTRRPQAFARTEFMALAQGTAQTIPGGGSQLLDVVRNIGPEPENKPGKAIRRTDRQLLDDSDPDWHTAKPVNAIRHYTFDDRAPRQFYCYPPAQAGVRVEVSYSRLPAPIAESDENGSLDIGPEYLEAVVNYVCYRCNAKDSEYAAPVMAASFYQAFEASLGIKSQTEAAASPNQPTNSV
jgi:hypothetical protein